MSMSLEKQNSVMDEDCFESKQTEERKKRRKNRLVFMCDDLLPGVSAGAGPDLQQITLPFCQSQLLLRDGTYGECILFSAHYPTSLAANGPPDEKQCCME